MAIRSRGATGGCCPDCKTPHKNEGGCFGCAGCVPEFLCVIIRLDSGLDADLFGCCKTLYGKAVLECGTSTYSNVSLACKTVGISVDMYITDDVDGCCFTVDVVSYVDQVSFSNCGSPPIIGLDEQAISIRVQAYPEVSLTGTIEVIQPDGVSNSGQFGNIEEGTCPPCGMIRMDRDTEPSWKSLQGVCDRPELSVADKTSIRVFGEDYQQQITDGDLASDEFCWFIGPCKCIPTKACITYEYFDCCFENKTKRLEIELVDCTYGPVEFAVERCGYETDTVTITGTLTNSCEVEWRVVTDQVDISIVRNLTRLEFGAVKYTSTCDISITDVSLPGTSVNPALNLDDIISIDTRCYCAPALDQSCIGACEAIAIPAATGNVQCSPPTLYAEIISDCASEIYPMGASPWGFGTGAPVIPADFGFTSACQNYVAYDPSLGPANLALVTGQCSNTTRQFEFHALGIFYDPPDCTAEELTEADPSNYYIYGRFVSFEGQWDFVHQVTTGSCSPFQLDFEIPAPGNMSDICYCSSTILIRVTL